VNDACSGRHFKHAVAGCDGTGHVFIYSHMLTTRNTYTQCYLHTTLTLRLGPFHPRWR
jgi:hypothetical protein